MDENLNKLIELIKFKAEEIGGLIDDEDENATIEDYAGGNIDDAYGCGMNDGEILFARELVKYIV